MKIFCFIIAVINVGIFSQRASAQLDSAVLGLASDERAYLEGKIAAASVQSGLRVRVDVVGEGDEFLLDHTQEGLGVIIHVSPAKANRLTTTTDGKAWALHAASAPAELTTHLQTATTHCRTLPQTTKIAVETALNRLRTLRDIGLANQAKETPPHAPTRITQAILTAIFFGGMLFLVYRSRPKAPAEQIIFPEPTARYRLQGPFAGGAGLQMKYSRRRRRWWSRPDSSGADSESAKRE